MKNVSFYIFLSVLILGAPQVGAKDLELLGDFPGWFQEAMAREKKVKKKTKLKIEQFNVNKKVKGKLTLEDHEEGTWYFNIDIGTGTPIECYVFTTYDGPANSLHAIAGNGITAIGAQLKKEVSNRLNYAVDVGVVHASPYLMMDTLYSLGEGEEKVSGTLKGLSAETNESLQVCIHNEIGYRKAFFSVFESFVGAFSAANKGDEFLKTISKMTINGIPVGFIEEKYALDSDGGISEKVKESMLLPVDENSMARTDSGSISSGRSDGTLINATDYLIENSKLISRYSISYKEDKWLLEGELQGKALKSTLDHSGSFISNFGGYQQTSKLMKSDKTALTFNMWVPKVDPVSGTEVALVEVPDNADANFKLEMGGTSMLFKANKNAILEHAVLESGAIKMVMETLYAKGIPKLP